MKELQQSMADIIDCVQGMINEIEGLLKDVDPSSLLSVLEERVRRCMQAIGRILIEQALQLYEECHPEPNSFECPECKGHVGHKARRQVKVTTIAGEVIVERKVYECRRCKKIVCPGLEQMGLNGRTFTPLLQEMMGLLELSLPERKASEMLRRLVGIRASAKTVADVAVDWGRWWIEEEKRGKVRASRQFGEKPIYVGVDGTMVCTKGGRWRELKVAAFYEGDKKQKVYYGSFSCSEDFAHELGRYAEATGAYEAPEVRVTGDGADWVWEVHSTNFPEASERFVDFWHVSEHIWGYAKMAYGEGTSRCKRWAKAMCHRLKHEGPASVLSCLKRQRPKGSDVREKLRKLRGYIEKRVDLMDYPGLIARGIDIGDGPVENACKQLGARLKGADKRWDIERVSAVAFLRCVYLSDEWDALPKPRMANRSAEQRLALQPMIDAYNKTFTMN